MSRRIIKIDRIIRYIAISIPCLRIVRAGNEAIGLEESANHGGVETCLVVHQSTHVFVEQSLSRITVVGGWVTGGCDVGASPAEGEVTLLGY